ncbi:MAG: ATP-binding protein [Parachlamydiaceae bacterium]|nr:ATP-binding protein [Parachlamydiaceae bacterium]
MFEELRELSQTFIRIKFEQFRRYFIETTPLKHRFSIILGERGIGKTTTLIQYLLDSTDQNPLSEKILYIQADHFLMGKTTLYDIAETFWKLGGKVIAFDEIHKYPNWSMELKSIYDTFIDLKILASGSSALEIHKGSHDLTRRAIVYRMYGLSLREFIGLKYKLQLQSYNLDQMVSDHTKLAFNIIKQLETQNLKILKLFKEYLEYGYYPYFRIFESVDEFKLTVEQNLHTALESDLVAIYPHLTGNSIKKIKQLITFIAQAVPFTPNWQAIKKLTDIGDDRTLKTYFNYLQDASIIQGLESGSDKMKRIEVPEKIFLANTNQLYSYCTMHPNAGTIRETFFLSSFRPFYTIMTARETDFLVEKKYYFEIGGKNKGAKQLRQQDKGYLALDDIGHGVGKRIPLWLFGFLY